MAHVAFILVQRLYLYAFRLFRHEEQADEESSSHRISRISALVFDHGLISGSPISLPHKSVHPEADRQPYMQQVRQLLTASSA